MLDDERQRRRQATRRARDQRHRQRLKLGTRCYLVEIDCTVFDMMIKLGWLAEREATDKRAVERAIGEMLAASART